jgi:hypothetical protein
MASKTRTAMDGSPCHFPPALWIRVAGAHVHDLAAVNFTPPAARKAIFFEGTRRRVPSLPSLAGRQVQGPASRHFSRVERLDSSSIAA